MSFSHVSAESGASGLATQTGTNEHFSTLVITSSAGRGPAQGHEEEVTMDLNSIMCY